MPSDGVGCSTNPVRTIKRYSVDKAPTHLGVRVRLEGCQDLPALLHSRKINEGIVVFHVCLHGSRSATATYFSGRPIALQDVKFSTEQALSYQRSLKVTFFVRLVLKAIFSYRVRVTNYFLLLIHA